MPISKDDNTYNTNEKRKWREFVYSLATPNNCSTLVDDDGAFQYKWLELVGDEANTFKQLLFTKRIREDQLIGIDREETNIKKCKLRFPQAEFYANEWNVFCHTYPVNDIGVIIFDSWCAAYGKNIDASLNATMNLALRCKKANGECLVVINVDGSKTYRGNGHKFNITSKEVLKRTIEGIFQHSLNRKLASLKINVDSMYEYKQHKQSTTMLTCGILF